MATSNQILCLIYSCPQYKLRESHIEHTGNILSMMKEQGLNNSCMQWKCPKVPYLNIIVMQDKEYTIVELHNIEKCGGDCEFDMKTAQKRLVKFAIESNNENDDPDSPENDQNKTMEE